MCNGGDSMLQFGLPLLLTLLHFDEVLSVLLSTLIVFGISMLCCGMLGLIMLLSNYPL